MTGRKIFLITFTSLLVRSVPTFQSPTDENTLIDDYIRSMSFDPNQVLVYNGSDLIEGVPKIGYPDKNNNFIVLTREKMSISEGKGKIGVVSANVHRTFPGSLLLANSHLLDNKPTTVTIGRAPLEYTVDLPGLTEDRPKMDLLSSSLRTLITSHP